MLYAITDGACAPNPGGICAYAFIIKNDKSEVLHKDSKRIGAGAGYTNNTGEYFGVIEALRWFSSREEKEITIASDSKLVINQMRGDWEVRGGAYLNAYIKARDLLNVLVSKGKIITFNWVPREYTAEADRLANQVIIGVRA